MKNRNTCIAALALGCMLWAKSSAGQTVKFGGLEWNVKDVQSSEPGNNSWRHANAWVDEKGQLHLKITGHGDKWECAEVSTVKRLGFGTYEFDVTAPLAGMDPNVILAMFNHPTLDIGPDGTNEIAMEFGQMGLRTSFAGSCTVLPANKGSAEVPQSSKFGVPPNTKSVECKFIWTSMSVEIDNSFKGGIISSATFKTETDNYLKSIPQKPEPMCIDLRLFRGKPPIDGKEIEIVVTRFAFTPAS
jgi:hypothetical protein